MLYKLKKNIFKLEQFVTLSMGSQLMQVKTALKIFYWIQNNGKKS